MKGTSSKIPGRCVTLAITLALVGCGGKSTSTPTPPEVSVTLNHSSVSLPVGGQAQFTATVQGTSNPAVTWSVDSVTGGNSTVGTIASAGLYTAPSQAGSHTVMATCVADTTKNATSAITVTSNASVSPGTALVVAGATQQLRNDSGSLRRCGDLVGGSGKRRKRYRRDDHSDRSIHRSSPSGNSYDHRHQRRHPVNYRQSRSLSVEAFSCTIAGHAGWGRYLAVRCDG
jgi:hypothetical protein